MTIAEILVVYLSCGAPFGVLVFLSRSSTQLRTIAESIIAAVLWPLLALEWTHRRLLLRHRRNSDRAPANAPEIPFLANDALFSKYETLTRSLADSKHDSSDVSAELFEAAGHSNPALAAVCAGRNRNALLDRRQKACSSALIEHLSRLSTLTADQVLSVADHCRRLGDAPTAELLQEIAGSLSPDNVAETAGSAGEPVQLAA